MALSSHVSKISNSGDTTVSLNPVLVLSHSHCHESIPYIQLEFPLWQHVTIVS